MKFWICLLLGSVLALPDGANAVDGVEAVDGKGAGCACPLIRPRNSPDCDGGCPVDGACSDTTTAEWVDCCCDYTLIDDLDFYYRYPQIGKDWSYYQNGAFVADGGSMTFGKKGGLLNTSRYNVTIGPNPVPYLDNYKYLVFANEPVALSQDQDLVVEWQAEARTFHTDSSPYPDVLLKCPGDDVRLAAASMNVWDPETELVFAFLLTNDMVYAVYGRNPDKQDPEDYNYASFTFVVPVLWRKPSDEHSLKVVLSARQRTVRWKIGPKEVFRVDAVGARISREYMTVDFGGANDLVFPTTIKYGFGSMTLLNHYPACWKACPDAPCVFPSAQPAQALFKTGNAQAPPQWDPKLAKPNPALFWNAINPAAEFRVWGQGSVTQFKRLSVYEQKCKPHNLRRYKTVTVTAQATPTAQL